MVAAIKQTVTVGPGGVVQVTSPELQPGTRAEVIVLVQSIDQKCQPSGDEAPLTSFIGSGKGSFSTVEEADAFIRNERDAWDR
jgi:hypothetical protein